MNGPGVPTLSGTVAVPLVRHRRVTFRAMASDVTLQLVDPGPTATEALAGAQQVFRDVEAACTRFDPDSPLMRANARGEDWTPVPRACFDALRAAHRAHLETAGLFDPRVLRTLEGLGYDRSLPFAAGGVAVPAGDAAIGWTEQRPAWAPAFDDAACAVRVGPEPVDLGGIGKGLAVHRAAALLAPAARGVLVEAGGDCEMRGPAPDGQLWLVGVEDPSGHPAQDGPEEPVAVVGVRDAACATSSVRVRRWTSGGRAVHHLIDPRTGAPGDGGLLSVSVVATDAARAETWSKALFLSGAAAITQLASSHDLAALWVTEAGELGTSPAAEPLVVWRRCP